MCLLPGCGEHLIRTMLARECSAAMQSEDAHQALLEAMQNKFISESPTCSLIPTAFHTLRFASQERVCKKPNFARRKLNQQTDVAQHKE